MYTYSTSAFAFVLKHRFYNSVARSEAVGTLPLFLTKPDMSYAGLFVGIYYYENPMENVSWDGTGRIAFSVGPMKQ